MLYEKFRIEKHCLVEQFAFLKNVCYQYLNLMLCITYLFFFPTSWLVLNQLSWNVLLFSCYPIGQLCLSDPSYNSSTVILGSLSNNDSNGNEDGKSAIKKNFRLTKQQLCMCITLFALSLQSPYDYNVKVSRDVNSRQWTLIQSFRIQLHTNFLTFDKLNQLE